MREKFLQTSCFYRLQYWVKPLNLSAPICDFNGPRANFKKLFPFGETSDRHAAYIFGILRQFWTKPASVYFNFLFENFLGRALKHIIKLYFIPRWPRLYRELLKNLATTRRVRLLIQIFPQSNMKFAKSWQPFQLQPRRFWIKTCEFYPK